MKIQTCLSPPDQAKGPTKAASTTQVTSLAVVIDVLRATTVAVTALAAGARCLVTCRDVEDAFTLRNAGDSDSPRILCGERDCKPIDGFDFGNSPGEYQPAGVNNRELILTTTNGTAAIDAVRLIPHVILGSFANLSAVVDRMIEHDQRHPDDIIRLVCAGTNGEITMEDVLFAGAAIALAHQQLSDSNKFFEGPVELLDDSSSLALAAWQHSLTHESVRDPETLAARLAVTRGGRNLIAAGYQSDLLDCASIDVFDVVPTRIATDPVTFTL